MSIGVRYVLHLFIDVSWMSLPIFLQFVVSMVIATAGVLMHLCVITSHQASKHHLYRHAVKKVPKSELTNLLPNKRAAAFWA